MESELQGFYPEKDGGVSNLLPQTVRPIHPISVRRGFRSPFVLFTLTALMAWLGIRPAAAMAKTPPPLAGPIATVGERKVEAIDIERAALSLGVDPPAGKTAAAWRRTLLDRCVDRELLAMEAEKRGLFDDPTVARRISEAEFDRLSRELYGKVLIPGLTPTPAEFDSIKAAGRYRWFDLDYILVRDTPDESRRALAEKLVQRARTGARWDSMAKIYSGHPPSAAAGGHFGPVLVKDIEPTAQDSVAHGAPGQVFGPYSGPYGHEIYKIREWIPIDDDSLMRILLDDRTRAINQNYWDQVLKKYHFEVDSLNAARAMTALRSESPDSILLSLRPDGTRPGLGVRPELGIVARVDGDAVTLGDIIRDSNAARNEHNRIRVRDRVAFNTLAARILLHRLIVRDAKDRGLDRDPVVARDLRLRRDEAATLAMVTRARPADPGSAALRSYIQKNASRYQRPAMRVARVAMFPNEDSARAALKAWNGIGFPADSVLKAMHFRERPARVAGSSTIYSGQFGDVAVAESGRDPLALALRALAPGQFAPVTRIIQGWAVAMMKSREDAAPLPENEAAPIALGDWREEMENQWVTDQLERLRAATPVNVVPARLDAVRITPPIAASGKKGAAR